MDLVNPARGIKLPPLDNWRERTISVDEEMDLHASYHVRLKDPGRYWDIVQVALHTGLRRHEQLSLRVRDFTGQALRVPGLITKTRKPRTVPLNATALAIVADACADCSGDQFIFLPTHKGTRYKVGERMYNNIWTPCCELAGIKGLEWRDLRRTFATRLVAKGTSLYVVQALLGHSNPRQTMRYSVLAADTLRAAVELLD